MSRRDHAALDAHVGLEELTAGSRVWPGRGDAHTESTATPGTTLCGRMIRGSWRPAPDSARGCVDCEGLATDGHGTT